ncbi:YciI family protein [Marinifilum sp. D714]|uniref:YciI family protein n=1 Tax=Marinifilum sp. D714 TaxID=2937523 RepID=UPI0027C002E5|nr:YciI family protein [Marinifilum sp. D714]MDQ2177962.1 YciI family protein [Marinifilum sp. D714]
MKLIKYGLFAAFGIFLSCSSNQPNENKVKNGYNAELATKLKADQYGMSKYVMAFLKRGPVRSQDSITAAKLQKAHLENIERLAEEGKLVLAGPFFDDGEIRGIYIFNVESIEEAKALTETDPAIKAGRLVMELHPWYGSAALKQVNKIHKSLQKQNVSEQ